MMVDGPDNTIPPALEDASPRHIDAPLSRQPRFRVIVRARWAEITLAGALAVYSVLAVFAHKYAYFGWDVSIDRGIQSVSIPGFHRLMVVVSALGSGSLPFTIVILTSAFLFAMRFRI